MKADKEEIPEPFNHTDPRLTQMTTELPRVGPFISANPLITLKESCLVSLGVR